jgi:membrane dipeptidase
MIIDAHLDLAYNVTRGRDVTMPAKNQPIADNEIATVGFPDMRAGDVGLIFATIFCSPKSYKNAGYSTPEEAHEQALSQLKQYRAWHDVGQLRQLGYGGTFHTPYTNTPQSLILLEGAEAIRTPADAKLFYDAGVRIVGLTWQKTRYAGGTSTPGPLTDLGRELVKELDRLGILLDASHLAERSFWDLFNFTGSLLIASHSNCRAIVGRDPGERHLTDAMIRAIAERGGVIGMNFYDKFLLPFAEFGKRRAKLDDVVAHIKHICDLTGSADHVAIGTDLDGGLGREQVPEEIETIADLGKLRDALIASKFTAEDAEKVMSGNWLRILRSRGWHE